MESVKALSVPMCARERERERYAENQFFGVCVCVCASSCVGSLKVLFSDVRGFGDGFAFMLRHGPGKGKPMLQVAAK